jgi:hypothetical protein
MTIGSGLSCRKRGYDKDVAINMARLDDIDTRPECRIIRPYVVVREDYSVRRIVLLLIVASIVMFAVVLKTPLRTLRSVVFPEADSTSEIQTPQKRESSAKGTRPPKTTPRSSALDRAETAEGNSTSRAGSPAGAEAKSPVARIRNLVSTPIVTISVESVALYSVNSTRGAILSVLRRGTVVVPSLQVMDGDVNWVLVRVPELNVSGFIQADKLAFNSGG